MFIIKLVSSKKYNINLLIVAMGVIIVYSTRLLMQMIVAAKFGASSEFDSYNVALVIPNLFLLVIAGSLERIFLPIVSEFRIKNGIDEAKSVVSLILIIFFVLLILISTLCTFFAPYIIKISAPGLDSESYIKSVELLKILAWILVPMGLVLPLTLLHNINERFDLPVFTDFIKAIIYLGTAVVLINILGIIGLALSFLLSVVVKLILLLISTRHEFSINQINFTSKNINIIYQTWLPIAVIQIFSQCYPIIDRYFASYFGTGAISYITYAYSLSEIPNAIIGYSVGVVFFPVIANAVVKQDNSELNIIVTKAIKSVFSYGLPLLIWMIVEREKIIALLLERGQFTNEDTTITSGIFLCYMVATFGGMIGNVTSKVIWAYRSIKFFFVLTLINIITYIVLINSLSVVIGLLGIAISLGVMLNISWIIQMLYIIWKIGPLKFQLSKETSIRSIIFLFIFTFGIYVISVFWSSSNLHNKVGLFVGLLFSFSFGIICLVSFRYVNKTKFL